MENELFQYRGSYCSPNLHHATMLTYICRKCDARFSIVQDLREHPYPKDLKCPDCGSCRDRSHELKVAEILNENMMNIFIKRILEKSK